MFKLFLGLTLAVGLVWSVFAVDVHIVNEKDLEAYTPQQVEELRVKMRAKDNADLRQKLRDLNKNYRLETNLPKFEQGTCEESAEKRRLLEDKGKRAKGAKPIWLKKTSWSIQEKGKTHCFGAGLRTVSAKEVGDAREWSKRIDDARRANLREATINLAIVRGQAKVTQGPYGEQVSAAISGPAPVRLDTYSDGVFDYELLCLTE